MADLLLDPSIVEEQVRRLNRTADSLGFVGVVLGLVPGAAVGALPLLLHTPIPSKFGFATLLLGALVLGGLGYMFGSSRSFGYRLRGQIMLGQLRLEQNVEALLAVSERPAPVPALPAPEPVHALPEPPRIEEIIQAGLAMPAAPPLVEAAPAAEPAPVAHEEVAPLPAVEHVAPVVVEPQPEPEPEPLHETLLPPAPSWAAALEQVLAPLAPEPVATPEPVGVPEPVAFPEPVAPPAPEPVVASEPEPAPAWSLPEPVREEPAPVTAPSWSFAPLPEPEPANEPEAGIEEEHVPLPEPLRPDFGSTMPAWAAPAPAPAPAPATAPEPEAEPEPVPPAAHTDLSALSIAEIARLADAGSL